MMGSAEMASETVRVSSPLKLRNTSLVKGDDDGTSMKSEKKKISMIVDGVLEFKISNLTYVSK